MALMPALFLDQRTMRRQARTIVHAPFGTIIMVTNAIKENHQDGPGNKEKGHGGKWIHLDANLQPLGNTSRQPVDAGCHWIFSQPLSGYCAEENHHTAKKRETGTSQGNGMADLVILMGK